MTEGKKTSFKVERLIKLTINGEGKFYKELEMKELRDALLELYPITSTSGIMITKSNVKSPSTWRKDLTGYSKDTARISQNFVNEILQYFINASDKEFYAVDLRNMAHSTGSKTYYALQVLLQENKIDKLYHRGKPYYKLKKLEYQRKAIDDKTNIVLKASDQNIFKNLQESKKQEILANREK